MSAGKHTPGPWAAEIARVVPESEPFGFFIRHAERRRSVVNCNVYETATPVLPVEWRDATITLTDWKGHHYTPDELVANALLIAAAPDLLASLRDMVDWLDDGNRQLSESASADVLKARAALSKATGLPQP